MWAGSVRVQHLALVCQGGLAGQLHLAHDHLRQVGQDGGRLRVKAVARALVRNAPGCRRIGGLGLARVKKSLHTLAPLHAWRLAYHARGPLRCYHRCNAITYFVAVCCVATTKVGRAQHSDAVAVAGDERSARIESYCVRHHCVAAHPARVAPPEQP